MGNQLIYPEHEEARVLPNKSGPVQPAEPVWKTLLDAVVEKCLSTKHLATPTLTSENLPNGRTRYQQCLIYEKVKEELKDCSFPVDVKCAPGLTTELEKASSTLEEYIGKAREELKLIFSKNDNSLMIEEIRRFIDKQVAAAAPTTEADSLTLTVAPAYTSQRILFTVIEVLINGASRVCDSILADPALRTAISAGTAGPGQAIPYERSLKLTNKLADAWEKYLEGAMVLEDVLGLRSLLNLGTQGAEVMGAATLPWWTTRFWTIYARIFSGKIYKAHAPDLGRFFANAVDDLLRLQMNNGKALKGLNMTLNPLMQAPIERAMGFILDMEVDPTSVFDIEGLKDLDGHMLRSLQELLKASTRQRWGDAMRNPNVTVLNYDEVLSEEMGYVARWLPPSMSEAVCREAVDVLIHSIELSMRNQLYEANLLMPANEPQPEENKRKRHTNLLASLVKKLKIAQPVRAKLHLKEHCPTLCLIYQKIHRWKKKHENEVAQRDSKSKRWCE